MYKLYQEDYVMEIIIIIIIEIKKEWVVQEISKIIVIKIIKMREYIIVYKDNK